MTDPEWTFESRIEMPSQIHISAAIHVPAHHSWPDVHDCSAITQTAAAQTLHRVQQALEVARIREEPPF